MTKRVIWNYLWKIIIQENSRSVLQKSIIISLLHYSSVKTTSSEFCSVILKYTTVASANSNLKNLCRKIKKLTFLPLTHLFSNYKRLLPKKKQQKIVLETQLWSQSVSLVIFSASLAHVCFIEFGGKLLFVIVCRRCPVHWPSSSKYNTGW